MPRGLDHIVYAVRDLDAAAELYRRLGFSVGARNIHPPAWGTQNRIVQLPGTFIELLALADTSAIAPYAARSFSFGAFNRDFLSHGEGLSMLVLEGRGAPNTGFFTCRHRHPENFWNPAFQVHANTAARVAGVVLVAANPSDHHSFISAFSGEREVLATSAGISVKTPRGEIQVMQPAAFRDHFGVEPPGIENGARLAALRLSVCEPDVAKRLLDAANLAANERMGRLIIGPETAMGATLVFERN